MKDCVYLPHSHRADDDDDDNGGKNQSPNLTD